jgi:hypothetical protein
MSTTAEPSFESLFEQVQENMPAVSAWAYVLIWAWSDMSNRMSQNPENPRFDEITFPHSNVPLFTVEQARSLEAAWPKGPQDPTKATESPTVTKGPQDPTKATESPTVTKGPQDPTEPATQQSGGGIGGIPTLADFSKGAGKLGEIMANLPVDAETFSLDKQYATITGTLDALDEQLQEFSKKYGLIALESVAPDPKFIIPTVPPIPIIIPVRIIMPLVNVFLEILRVSSTLVPGIGIIGKPITVLLFLMELARGNLYGAIFTMFGITGKYPMYAGILMKVLYNAYQMIAPEIRGELRDVVFKSSKSFVSGFVIWVFSVLSPDIVRRPIVEVLDRVRELADNFNQQMSVAEAQATAALKGLGVMQFPRIANEYIPSIGDLYVIQTLVQNPRVYCDDQVAPLITEMRAIPPLALFFDLLNIPTPGTAKFTEACASIAGKTLARDFAPKFVPAALPKLPTFPTGK